jgi:hypothetical protein
MTWDIFVQDLPPDVKGVADIPEDFVPQPIGSRSRVIYAIRAAAPFAKFSGETHAQVDAPEINMEIMIGPDDPLRSFAFHIFGGNRSAGLVADILSRLQIRALDPLSDSGIFDSLQAARSLQRWQEYRRSILELRAS